MKFRIETYVNGELTYSSDDYGWTLTEYQLWALSGCEPSTEGNDCAEVDATGTCAYQNAIRDARKTGTGHCTMTDDDDGTGVSTTRVMVLTAVDTPVPA